MNRHEVGQGTRHWAKDRAFLGLLGLVVTLLAFTAALAIGVR